MPHANPFQPRKDDKPDPRFVFIAPFVGLGFVTGGAYACSLQSAATVPLTFFGVVFMILWAISGGTK